jgi:hypothetical protein
MSFFVVAPTVGSYRTTSHPKTKVQKTEGSMIPVNGLSLTKIGEVSRHTTDQDYLIGEKSLGRYDLNNLFSQPKIYVFFNHLMHLVDVIGLMIGISVEREYVRDGKVTKMIVFELTDDKCLLLF